MKKALFALALALAASASSGAAPEVVSDYPEPGRIVRTLDGLLGAVFRFPGRRTPEKRLRFVFDPKAKEKIVRSENARRIEYRIRDDGKWRNDPEVFARISGALFARRAGCDARECELPRFLLAGMRGQLRSLGGPRTVDRGNHQMPFLRAFLAAGKTVDFSCSAPDGDFVPAQIYQEGAAIVLLGAAARREGLLDAVRKEIVSGGRPTEKLLLLLDDAARRKNFPDADRMLADLAAQYAWHRHAPRSVPVSRRTFARLRMREMPELDLFGRPTGRTSVVDLEVFHPLLFQRPDAAALLQKLRDDLSRFLRGESPECRRILRRIGELETTPDVSGRLHAELAALDAAWERREKTECFLENAEIVCGGIGAHCPGRIDAARPGREALSPRGKKFFDRVEALYLGE